MSLNGVQADFAIKTYFENLTEKERMAISRRSSPLDDLLYIGMSFRQNNVMDVIEIGGFLGMSALFIAPNIRGKYYSINISQTEIEAAAAMLNRVGVNNVQYILGDSLDVLPSLAKKLDSTLDAVYIDGYHSYHYSYGEYNIVAPYLSKRGKAVAIFDDAASLHPDGKDDGGVPRAVLDVGAVRIPFLNNRIAIKTFGQYSI